MRAGGATRGEHSRVDEVLEGGAARGCVPVPPVESALSSSTAPSLLPCRRFPPAGAALRLGTRSRRPGLRRHAGEERAGAAFEQIGHRPSARPPPRREPRAPTPSGGFTFHFGEGEHGAVAGAEGGHPGRVLLHGEPVAGGSSPPPRAYILAPPEPSWAALPARPRGCPPAPGPPPSAAAPGGGGSGGWGSPARPLPLGAAANHTSRRGALPPALPGPPPGRGGGGSEGRGGAPGGARRSPGRTAAVDGGPAAARPRAAPGVPRERAAGFGAPLSLPPETPPNRFYLPVFHPSRIFLQKQVQSLSCADFHHSFHCCFCRMSELGINRSIRDESAPLTYQ